jgi:type IX secretion system substrate protein
MKKALTFMLGIFLIAGILNAQTFNELFFDLAQEQSDAAGIHGVAVGPDGNVWIAMFGSTEDLITTEGDTLNLRPLFVLDPVTKEHVSFSPIKFLTFPDATTDTMSVGARGIEVDNNGNILYSAGSTLYRVNSSTGEGMNKWIPPKAASLTEAVQSPADGNIYITHVVPGGAPIYMLDSDLNLIGNAVDSVFVITRTLEISQDGTDLYMGTVWNGDGIRHYHSDAPGLTKFEQVGENFGNWSADSKLWSSCLDFAPDGILWAGNLKDVFSGDDGKGSKWYGFDVAKKAIVREVGFPWPADSSTGGVYSPRGAAWSPDGSIMYLADFDYSTISAWNYTPYVEPDSIDLSVTYQADMELEILKGSFDPATDTVEVRGAFFGWGSEAPDMTPNAINPNVYEHTATQRATLGDNLPNYKFYYTVGNWEGGNDKTYQVTQADYDAGFAVVARPFNDATLDDVVNQDVTVLFTVNTAGAISAVNNTAFTEVNTVHITGAVQPLTWPDGGWPDDQIDRMLPLFDDGTNGDETSGDGIFSANITFPQYTSFRIQYKYGINYSDAANNQGGNDNENGVGADHFIDLTADLATAKVENVFGEMGDHVLVDMVTGVEELDQLPTGYELSQNYPNPFNPNTQIKFQLNGQEDVSLKVYNLLGQEVATLLNESMSAGVYEVSFDASQLSSGVYIYTISAGEFYSSKKMTLLK